MRSDRDDDVRSKIVLGDFIVKINRTKLSSNVTLATCVSIIQQNTQRPIQITFQRRNSGDHSNMQNNNNTGGGADNRLQIHPQKTENNHHQNEKTSNNSSKK